ncbi:hypothetical protein B0H11DRAFT_547132 [Mycena galericulata]|nr:hypothetical protein B0H11DRAFT_547132 [Mycena galericulata]
MYPLPAVLSCCHIICTVSATHHVLYCIYLFPTVLLSTRTRNSFLHFFLPSAYLVSCIAFQILLFRPSILTNPIINYILELPNRPLPRRKRAIVADRAGICFHKFQLPVGGLQRSLSNIRSVLRAGAIVLLFCDLASSAAGRSWHPPLTLKTTAQRCAGVYVFPFILSSVHSTPLQMPQRSLPRHF